MCYDSEIFKSKIDDNLFCPICRSVLCKDSMQDEHGHTFCASCINKWISRHKTCPINRDRISVEGLRPIPLAFKGILNNLEVKCRFTKNGCTEIRKLEVIKYHEKTCVHNLCSECGYQRKSNHKCVDELKKVISKLKMKLETANILLANTKVTTETHYGESFCNLTNESSSISLKQSNSSGTDSDEKKTKKEIITLNYTDTERNSKVASAMTNSGDIKNKLLFSKSTKLSPLIKTSSIENNSIFYNKSLRKNNELNNDYRSSSSSPGLHRRSSIINNSNMQINN